MTFKVKQQVSNYKSLQIITNHYKQLQIYKNDYSRDNWIHRNIFPHCTLVPLNL